MKNYTSLKYFIARYKYLIQALFGIFTFIIAIYACASSSTLVDSFVDSKYDNKQFDNLLVIGNTKDMQWRIKLETSMVENLRIYGVHCMESIRLAPPTRKMTQEEIRKSFEENHITGYLVLTISNMGTSDVYIPPFNISNKTGIIHLYSNTAVYNENGSTISGGGYLDTAPYANYKAQLIDLFTSDTVYTAYASSSGNHRSNFHELVSSFCYNVVEDMDNKNIIK